MGEVRRSSDHYNVLPPGLAAEQKIKERKSSSAGSVETELEPLNLDREDKKGKIDEPEDFDELLETIGSEGRFQKELLYVILCPITCLAPFIFLSNIFMLHVPDHWCHVPFQPNDTSLQDWKNISIPMEEGPDGLPRFSQCKMYVTNQTGYRTVEDCQFGWDYDTTDYDVTIPSQYDWVCSKLHYATMVFTANSMSGVAGTIIFGLFADKVGRKPLYVMGALVNLVTQILKLYVVDRYYMFLTLYFIGGVSSTSVFNAPMMIAAETSGKEYRAWIYASIWMIWVIGNSIIPIIAMLCRNWFIFGWTVAIPALLLVAFIPILVESPRWQIAVGRSQEAEATLFKIAKRNGTLEKLRAVHGHSLLINMSKKLKPSAEKVGVSTLFSNKRLIKNTIMLSISWSTMLLLYYGVTLNVIEMAGNQFLNYFLLSIIELPCGYIGGRLINITGRRWTECFFFLVTAISCLLCALTVSNPSSAWITVTAATGIKFGTSIASLVVYIQGVELFPTQLRSTGSGFASTISSITSIMGPYIVYTGKFNVSTPYYIFTALAFTGMVSSSFLPETLGLKLPSTVEDLKVFGKNDRYWSFLPHSKASSNDQNHTNSTKE